MNTESPYLVRLYKVMKRIDLNTLKEVDLKSLAKKLSGELVRLNIFVVHASITSKSSACLTTEGLGSHSKIRYSSSS